MATVVNPVDLIPGVDALTLEQIDALEDTAVEVQLEDLGFTLQSDRGASANDRRWVLKAFMGVIEITGDLVVRELKAYLRGRGIAFPAGALKQVLLERALQVQDVLRGDGEQANGNNLTPANGGNNNNNNNNSNSNNNDNNNNGIGSNSHNIGGVNSSNSHNVSIGSRRELEGAREFAEEQARLRAQIQDLNSELEESILQRELDRLETHAVERYPLAASVDRKSFTAMNVMIARKAYVTKELMKSKYGRSALAYDRVLAALDSIMTRAEFISQLQDLAKTEGVQNARYLECRLEGEVQPFTADKRWIDSRAEARQAAAAVRKGHLADKDERGGWLDDGSSTFPQAKRARQQNTFSSSQKLDKKCYGCGQLGHLRSQCSLSSGQQRGWTALDPGASSHNSSTSASFRGGAGTSAPSKGN
jgi:hypothetical protein